MDRRRFIVGTASAATVSAALATDACSSSAGGQAGIPPIPPGSRVYDLTVQYATTTIKGYKLRTRTYNGKTTGPMLETRPGDTLSVRIINKLPFQGAAEPPRGSVPIPDVRTMMEAMETDFRGGTRPSSKINEMNNPHGFNVTNLHVHGLQTTPHLFEPVGTRDPRATMIQIGPGHEKLYNLPIASNQPSGLYWYHPHKHGSVDVQVSGGMAGLIVVRGPIDRVPEIAAAREIFMAFQTLNVNESKTNPGTYDLEYKAYKTPKQGGYNLSAEYTMITTNGEGVCWVDNNKNVYTPLGVPRFSVQPGEVVRLRMLNGTNALPFLLALPGFDVWEIGFDGINLLEPRPKDMSGAGVSVVTPENLFTAPVRVTAEANRIELLIRAPQKPGSYKLSSLASNGVSFEPIPAIELAEFVVSGSPLKMAIPAKLPKPVREYPVIRDDEIVNRRTLVFSEGPASEILTGFGFKIDGTFYDEMQCDIQPKVGTCEEWRLENSSAEVHPFHIHVNSFEIVAINDVKNSPPDVWDTFFVPPKANGKNGSLTIRMRFQEWYGKTVLHCHILPHEDTGMMRNVLLV
jgi:suppressor of ftsI